MIWKDFSYLSGRHALCGGSNSSWRNKSPKELIEFKINSYAQAIGTLCHEFACENIIKRDKIPKREGKYALLRKLTVENNIPKVAVDIDRIYPTVFLYVNDCIGFRMSPEIKLYYSDDYFGTADAIYFEHNTLRISDLKTGKKPVTSFEQLENYAAYFCLCYSVNPKSIKKIEFRIYQDSKIYLQEPDNDVIYDLTNKIIEGNKVLEDYFGGGV